MLVDLVNELSVNSAVNRKPKTELGKDEFLQLLVQQLKNQDPLNPLENYQFIAELAQFNQLEQQINMNDSFEQFLGLQQLNQAGALIGMTVAYFDEDGSELSGIVDSVELVNGQFMLNVSGSQIGIDDVVRVSF